MKKKWLKFFKTKKNKLIKEIFTNEDESIKTLFLNYWEQSKLKPSFFHKLESAPVIFYKYDKKNFYLRSKIIEPYIDKNIMLYYEELSEKIKNKNDLSIVVYSRELAYSIYYHLSINSFLSFNFSNEAFDPWKKELINSRDILYCEDLYHQYFSLMKETFVDLFSYAMILEIYEDKEKSSSLITLLHDVHKNVESFKFHLSKDDLLFFMNINDEFESFEGIVFFIEKTLEKIITDKINKDIQEYCVLYPALLNIFLAKINYIAQLKCHTSNQTLNHLYLEGILSAKSIMKLNEKANSILYSDAKKIEDILETEKMIMQFDNIGKLINKL